MNTDLLTQLVSALIDASNAMDELKDAHDWTEHKRAELHFIAQDIDRALMDVQQFAERERALLERA